VQPTSPRPSPPEPAGAAAGAGGLPATAGTGGSPAAGPGCGGFYTARDARNQRRANLWLFAATLAYLGATAAIHWRASLPRALPWLLAGLTALLFIVAVRSLLVFLRGADELLRKIQIEALALGFGAGAVFSLLYPLFEKLGGPEVGENATPLVMMLAWGAGSWLGARRYAGSGAP
jgi:hypothetical protein